MSYQDRPGLNMDTSEFKKRACANRVRYIKLGEGGKFFTACHDSKLAYIGFWSHLPSAYQMARDGHFDEYKDFLCTQKKSTSKARQHANEVKRFFQDNGKTLWVTFENQKLYWCFFDENSGPSIRNDYEGVTRPVYGKWRDQDLNGKSLDINQLPGALTKTQGYRGTSCQIEKHIGEYLIRRILGERIEEVEMAHRSLKDLKVHVEHIIRHHLDPKDFELLVDLIFSTSGWRRISLTGGTQKLIDIAMVLPSTNEKAFVQAKMNVSQKDFEFYKRQLAKTPYDRLFFAYANGNINNPDDSQITLLDGTKIADHAIRSGLTHWLLERAC